MFIRAYIHAIDERGKPAVIRGNVVGADGGWVDFQPEGTHDSVYIHKRFVFDGWLAAYKMARKASRRFRAGARNGNVLARSNGSKAAEVSQRTSLRPSDQEVKEEQCLSHSKECGESQKRTNGVCVNGRDSRRDG